MAGIHPGRSKDAFGSSTLATATFNRRKLNNADYFVALRKKAALNRLSYTPDIQSRPPARRRSPELENLIMEHSSSKPKNFDADPIGNLPRGVSPNGAKGADDNDLNEQIIADRLLAALSGGNLVHLEEARKSFVKREPTEQELADLAAQLERRSAPRDTGRSVVSDDQLRKEEEGFTRNTRDTQKKEKAAD